jgi:hypothetical protein
MEVLLVLVVLVVVALEKILVVREMLEQQTLAVEAVVQEQLHQQVVLVVLALSSFVTLRQMLQVLLLLAELQQLQVLTPSARSSLREVWLLHNGYRFSKLTSKRRFFHRWYNNMDT